MNRKIQSSIVLFVIMILLLGIASCTKQDSELIIARAGKTAIPLSEFRERYEFTPQILQTKDSYRNKRNALISLLGEKMLAADAWQRGWDQNEKFRTYSEQMENEAVVEALFDQEISSHIQISEDELKRAFFQSQSELDIQVLSFKTMEHARQAKQQIAAGKSLHQVKREFQTDTFISADSVLSFTMKWGEAHPELEAAAYQLQPNEISEPVEADGIVFLIKLVQRRSNVLITEGEFLNQAASIKKTIQNRKRAMMTNEYLHSLMADKKVHVSHQVFDLVAGELEKIYQVGDSSLQSQEQSKFLESPLEQAHDSDLASHWSDPFARFNDGSIWTVGEFIKKLSIGPYPLNYKSSELFRKSLNGQIRRMIELESLAKKGKELGLQNSYYVRYQTKMWQDAYLAQQLLQQVIDTVAVSAAEVKDYYNTHKNKYSGPEIIKVQEILVDNESLAHELYRRVAAGEDMGSLARQYTKRDLGREQNGVLGYFTVSSLGKIGEVARTLKAGEIGGPVKTETNQFSIFKLLDKKEAGPQPLEEIMDAVRQDALSEKRSRSIDNFLIQLKDKYPIKINQTMLDSLHTTDVSMLVLKQHFPNRTAAPLVMPLHESSQWQKLMNEILPLKR
ncbi:MAG: peptidyl-prolyl cis-trans isomerase [bacterium]|nr:peptidyl-prolyl cis-trans isomerase [bacterium]